MNTKYTFHKVVIALCCAVTVTLRVIHFVILELL